MKRPMDHLPPRRALGDVRGARAGERVSDYFDFKSDPDRAKLKVTRAELLAMLTRQWQIQREGVWYRRFWRWLRARPGSKPVPVGAVGAERRGEAEAAAEMTESAERLDAARRNGT